MRCAVISFFGLFLSFSLHAQQQMQPPQQAAPAPDEPQFYFYETINLVADDSTKSRVDIPYRIDNQFFIAVKNTNVSLPYPFVRRGEVYIELLDKDDVSKARDIQRLEIGENETVASPEVKSWHEGLASFTVEPGEYTVVFEIDDLESSRKFLDKNRKVVAKKFDGAALETSTPLFVLPPNANEPGKLTPINYGANMLFGKGAALFVQLQARNLTLAPLRVEYSITTQLFFLQDPKAVLADTIKELLMLQNNSPLIF